MIKTTAHRMGYILYYVKMQINEPWSIVKEAGPGLFVGL